MKLDRVVAARKNSEPASESQEEKMPEGVRQVE